MLNIPEFNEILREQNEHYYRITVEKNELPYVCMNCGCVVREGQNREDIFKPHQLKERTVSDLAIHGKAVRIIIRHKRYKCVNCNGTFYELLDSVDRNDKVTRRLKKHITQLALKRPFTNIADEYGRHNNTKEQFYEWVKNNHQQGA